MKHVERHKVYGDTKDIPDGELFFVHDTGQQSFMVTTHNWTEPTCALGVRIKGMVYTSDYIPERAADWKRRLDKAMEQMAVLTMSGWTTVAEAEDEFGYKTKLYRCAYCNVETSTPSGSCICRITARALAKK